MSVTLVQGHLQGEERAVDWQADMRGWILVIEDPLIGQEGKTKFKSIKEMEFFNVQKLQDSTSVASSEEEKVTQQTTCK